MRSDKITPEWSSEAWRRKSTAMQGEVFEAFRSINVPEDKALKAAQALSGRDNDVIDLKRDMTLLKWMVGTLYPLIFAILLKDFYR